MTPKNLNGRFCSRPFSLLEIHKEFYSFACCPSWLPTVVGNYKTTPLMQVWNSQEIQKIRASILDGSFSYCNHEQCPYIQEGSLPLAKDMRGEYREIIDHQITELTRPPVEYALCYDDSCNLACPSCRADRMQFNSGPEYEIRKVVSDKFLEEVLSQSTHSEVILRVTGSGDPFASKIFNRLLTSIDGQRFSNLKISLQTNGLLFTPKAWGQLHKLHNNAIWVGVSIDAASAATYAKVRKFGDWGLLLENLNFLSELQVSKKIKSLQTNFVVQTDNFHEIVDFAYLCLRHPGIKNIFYSLVTDWGSWPQEEYIRQCIWREAHPQYKDFLTVLASPILDHEKISLGNLTAHRQRALGFTEIAY